MAIRLSLKTVNGDQPSAAQLAIDRDEMQLRLKKALLDCPLEDFGKFCKLDGTVYEDSEVIQRYTVNSRVFALAIKEWFPGHAESKLVNELVLSVSLEDVMSVDSPAFKPPTQAAPSSAQSPHETKENEQNSE